MISGNYLEKLRITIVLALVACILLAATPAFAQGTPAFLAILAGHPDGDGIYVLDATGNVIPGGPIPAAFALAGTNLFLWMAIEPDRVHRLMNLVTESFIRCTDYFDQLCGRKNRRSIGLGCDTAEMISEATFKEFVAPYYLRIYEKYPGTRSLHNCGKSGHLLDSMRDLSLELHEPEKCETALGFNAPWEGMSSAYVTEMRDEDRYRMYYRGSGARPGGEVTCCAESKDGIRWNRPSLGIFRFNDSLAVCRT